MEMSVKNINDVENNTKNKLMEDDNITVPLKNEENRENAQGQGRNRAICECFREYSANTSIHGVQYLGEANRPMWERVFWVVVFIISIYTCSSMIYKLWRKWNDSPVIVSFDERETEIWRIPFPSVTICPQIKSDVNEFSFEKHLQNNFQNLTDSEKAYAKALLHVCELPRDFYKDFINETDEIDIIRILKNISPMDIPFVEIKGEDLEDYTSLIVTDEGLCYNFNGVRAKDIYSDKVVIPDFINDGVKSDWSRGHGYRKDAGINAYPFRVLGSGIKLGLEMTMFSLNIAHDNLCSLPSDGYKVLIHSPDNIPMISSKFFNLPTKQHVIAAIKPNMMWTSEELRSYSPEKRQCYFNEEKTLKYFKVYTQINCELECLTDYVLSKCDCVKFSMPRLNETRICQDYKDIVCYENAEKEFINSSIASEYFQTKDSMKERCNCLLPCTTIVYNIETSQSALDLSKISKAMEGRENYVNVLESMTVSQLTVFFKETSFLTSKRSELYGMSEFVANCGGLLGLFMGFSVLSFVEIFYFSILRTFTNVIRRREQVWL